MVFSLYEWHHSQYLFRSLVVLDAFIKKRGGGGVAILFYRHATKCPIITDKILSIADKRWWQSKLLPTSNRATDVFGESVG